MTIRLNEPKTLTLQPQTIGTILDALAELPFKVSNGPINEILEQLKDKPSDGA